MATDGTAKDVILQIGADSSGVNAPIEQTKAKLGELADAAIKAGDRAAQGIDKTATEAEKGAARVAQAEQRLANQIKRVAATTGLQKDTVEFFEAVAKNRNVSVDALRPYLDQLAAAKQRTDAARLSLEAQNATMVKSSAEAKRLQWALSGVPAQFTDIFVSMASGQAPMTVLLQQGGQLKDMFGSVGAAARGLGAYVAGLINPFTLAAGALAAVGYGYVKGAGEAEAYNAALIATGNAVGLTAGQLAAMAASMSTFGVSQHAAAASISELVKTSKIGADNLERFALAAVQMEKAGGPAVSETAKAFSDLANEPLKATLKLNDAMGYLSKAAYEQIKVLDEAGRVTEAAKVAQEAYADAIEKRAPKMVENLGYVERAWKALKDASLGPLETLMNLGRQGDELGKLQSKLADVSKSANDPNLDPYARANYAREAEQIRQQIAVLTAQTTARQSDASAQARQVELTKAQIDADKVLAQYADKKTLQRQEEAKVQNALLRAGWDQLDIERELDKVRAKYAEKDKAPKIKEEKDAWESLRTTLEKTAAGVDGLTESEKLQIELQKKQYQGTTLQDAAMRLYLTSLASAIDIEKQNLAVKKDVEKIDKAATDAAHKYAAEQLRSIDVIDQQIERQKERNASLISGKDATIDLQIAELERQRTLIAGLPAEASDLDVLDQRIVKLKELRDLTAQGDQIAAMKQAAADTAREWTQMLTSVANALGSFFIDLVDNGAKAFQNLWKRFRNWALQALADVAAKQIVVSIVGAVSGTAASTALASTGSSGAGGVNFLGAAGSSLGLVNPYGAGFSLAQNTWGAGAGFGGSMGAGASALMGGAGIGAGIGFATSSIFGNGYNNSNMQLASTIGGAIGGALAGPVGAVVGSLLGSAIGSLDSTGKPQQRTGTWMSSTSDTLPRGNTLFQSKSAFGGMGIVDDRWFSNSDMGESVQNFLKAIATVDNAIAAAVGPDVTKQISENLAKVTTTFDAGMEHSTVQFGDIVKQRYSTVLNTVEAGLGDLISNFQGTSEELGNFVVDVVNTFDQLKHIDTKAIFGEIVTVADLQPLVAEGDTLTDTLTNLVNVFAATNDATSLLGVTFGDVGLISAGARQELVDFAGGVQQLQSELAYFYDNFFSETEKQAMLTQSLTESFAALNTTLPASRDAYKDMVLAASKDTSTAGRQLLASLLDLGPAVAQLYPQIDTLTAAMQKATQVAQERAGLEERLLTLQGNVTELRRRELAALDPSNRYLQEQIWALEDAQAAQQAYADAVSSATSAYDSAAQAVASAQSAVDAVRSRGTDAYIAAQDKVAAAQKALTDAQVVAATKLRDSAANLRAYIDQQLGTSSAESFASVLTRALQLDPTALGKLSDAASNAIDSARESARSSSEFNQARARILAEVSRVADIAAAEAAKTTIPTEVDPVQAARDALAAAQTAAAEALRVATAIQAPLTKTIDDLITEYNKAAAALAKAQSDQEAARLAMNAVVVATQATVTGLEALKLQFETFKLSAESTIDFIVGSTLPDDLKELALAGTRSILATVNFAAGSDLPADIKAFVLETAHDIDVTTNFLVGGDLPEDVKRLALQTNDVVTKFFDFVVRGDGLSVEQRTLALATSSDLTRTVQLVAGSTIDGDLKKLVLNTVGSYTATIQATLETTESESLKTMLLSGASQFSATITAAIATAGMDETTRRVLIDQAGVFTTSITSVLASSIPDEQKALLLNATTASTRAVTLTAALSSSLTDDQRALLNQVTETVSKSVAVAATGGVLTEAQLLALKQADETVTKTIETLLDDSSLSQGDKDLIGAISSSTSGSVTLSGGVTWDAGNETLSVFNAIKESTAWLGEIHGYLGVIAGNLGGWPAEIYGYLGLIYSRQDGQHITFDRGDGSGVWGKGGAFTNSILAAPTMTSVGTAGEAGPEAIMPLSRGADGNLGVRLTEGGRMGAEIRLLRDDNRAQARSMAQLQSRVARVLERWDGDGMPEQRAAA